MASKDSNIGSIPGFKTPLGKTAQEGDAADASPAATPYGPVPDPIGNISNKRPGGPGFLKDK